jgi:hypothetical protein
LLARHQQAAKQVTIRVADVLIRNAYRLRLRVRRRCSDHEGNRSNHHFLYDGYPRVHLALAA